MTSTKRLLDHEAKVARPDTSTIPAGETRPSRSFADVQSGVVCETHALRGGLSRQPFGGEREATHQTIFEPGVSIAVDYLYRMDAGPYQGDYFRVTGIVERFEDDHVTVVAEFQADDTDNDPLAGE